MRYINAAARNANAARPRPRTAVDDPPWAELINSEWHDHLGGGRRADRLDDDRWLAGFLARAGWVGARLPDAAGRERLRALRAVLRRAVDALLAGRTVAPAAVAALNDALATHPLAYRLERRDGGLALALVPTAGEIDVLLGTVAASFAAVLAHGETGRVKRCANPDCRWVIYDASRNGARRWCEERVCGSLMRVRRLRARRLPTSE